MEKTYPPKPLKVAFSNTTMRQLVKDKPHIALICGFWRVSSIPKTGNVYDWFTAYDYTNKKNDLIRANKCT